MHISPNKKSTNLMWIHIVYNLIKSFNKFEITIITSRFSKSLNKILDKKVAYWTNKGGIPILIYPKVLTIWLCTSIVYDYIMLWYEIIMNILYNKLTWKEFGPL